MKKVSHPSLIFIVSAVLVLDSCTGDVPEEPVQPKSSPTETARGSSPALSSETAAVPPETLTENTVPSASAPSKSSTPSNPTPTPTPSSPPSTFTPTPTPTKPLPPLDAFMQGIWFNDWGWGFDQPRPPIYGPLYYPPQADPSLKALATTGANWINVVVCIFQETLSSTNITSNQYKTASDQALGHVIDLAHSLGIRVVLIPGLFLSNDPDHSWVQIGSAFTNETQWQAWFASYREHINHYASLAQEAGADMFYVGSELPGTTHREDDWRQTVREVRERFKGPISYDSVAWGNPTAEYKRIKWWDAVDYICTDFWFSLTNKNDPTIAELKQGWADTDY